MNSTPQKVFPKSVNMRPCIGPCFPKGEQFTHPLYFSREMNANYNICPTFTYNDEKGISHNVDRCKIASEHASEDVVSTMILSPEINFTSEMFLNIYYEIKSVEEALLWVTNNNFAPKNTIKRIINNALCAFGKNLDYIDTRLVQIMTNVLLDSMEYIYDVIYKFIDVRDGIVLMNESHIKKEELKEGRIEYIKTVFLSADNMIKFLTKYVKYRSDKWDEIEDHYNKILQDFIEYTTTQIKNVISSRKPQSDK